MGCPERGPREYDAVEVLLHIGSMPSPEAFAPVLGARQARNEVALHGVSPIAWGCQNEARSSKVL